MKRVMNMLKIIWVTNICTINNKFCSICKSSMYRKNIFELSNEFKQVCYAPQSHSMVKLLCRSIYVFIMTYSVILEIHHMYCTIISFNYICNCKYYER